MAFAKAPKLIFNESQYRSFKKALGLQGTPHENITLVNLLREVDIKEFKEGSSIYHMVGYKPYERNIKPFWKRIRGVIIKNYEDIVCGSLSATPVLTIEGTIQDLIREDKSGRKTLTLTETLENGSTVQHTIPFNSLPVRNREGKLMEVPQYLIRPSFQGTVIRVWLSDDVLHYSSLRKPSIVNAKWVQPEAEEPEEKLTFAEKFTYLSGYGRDELFAPGVTNSPFCHVFLMCTSQTSSSTLIDCGQGFILYLKTERCYIPKGNEEKTNFLDRKIPTEQLSEQEIDAGVETWGDRYIFPLSLADTEDYLGRFVPPPSLKEFFEPRPQDDGTVHKPSAVYGITEGMSLEEADNFLLYGVNSHISLKDLNRIRRDYPLFLPGESLHITVHTGGEEKTYIINPTCVNFRATVVKNVNNRRNQLVQLRGLASQEMDEPTGNPFTGIEDDLKNKVFEDVCQVIKPKKGSPYYFGISNDEPEIPEAPFDNTYSILRPPEGIVEYIVEDISSLKTEPIVKERGTYTNTRWFIIAYYYCLCLPPSRRQAGWNSFRQIYSLYLDSMEFIVHNYLDILDRRSFLYSLPTNPFAFADTKEKGSPWKEGLTAMEKIIKEARTLEYSRYVAELGQRVVSDNEVNISNKNPTKIVGSGEDKNIERVQSNIRSLFRDSDPTSLYRMMKLVKNQLKRIET